MAAVALGEPGVPVTWCASAALAPNPSAQLTSDRDRQARAIRLGNLIVAHCLSIVKYHVQATSSLHHLLLHAASVTSTTLLPAAMDPDRHKPANSMSKNRYHIFGNDVCRGVAAK
jgi:hypothetical protein